MKFQATAYNSHWARKLEDHLTNVQIQCMVEFGVDVGLEFLKGKSKSKPDVEIIWGFYFYLYNDPDVKYECAEDLRHALKNKSFI